MASAAVPGVAGQEARPPTPPGHPRLPRSDLVRRLSALAQGGVAVLVAPSGYGVTSLLALVAEASPDPVVWVSVQGSDPISSFAAQLADGMARFGVVPEAAPNADDPGQLERLVAQLMTAAAGGPQLLLVIDDVTGDTLETALQQVLDDLPTTMRVLVRTRVAPRLDLSRLLGSGRAMLLERADLALSRDEAEEYVRGLAPDLPARRRTALVAVADGWIAALRASLTATAADRHPDPAAWLLGPGLELLFGRALQQLDGVDRDLLVTSSVLEWLVPEACDAVTGTSGSAERLAGLSQRLLVRRVPGADGMAFAVHPLFREFLREKLAERGRGAQANAHRAAGIWLAQHGDADGAISNLLDCGQVDQAREVLSAHVGALLDSGRSDRVRAWYRRAPELAVPDQHLHVLGAAWSELLSGDPAAAGTHLVELQAAVGQDLPHVPEWTGGAAAGAQWLQTEALFLRSYLKWWSGQTDRAAEDLREVRARYDDGWSKMSHQSSAFLQVRLDLWNGEPAAARARLLEVSGRPGTLQFYRQVAIPSLGALLAAEEGRAHRASFLAASALDAVASIGQISVIDSLDARLARTLALVDLGELGEAAAESTRIAGTAGELGHIPYLVLGQLAGARALAMGGEPAKAEERLESARLALRRRGVRGPMAEAIDRVAVEVTIAAGDRQGARRAVEQLPAGRARDLLMVRVMAMGGVLKDAEVVRQVRAGRPDCPRDVVETRMLMAALTAPTRPAEAAMHLRAAADLAHEHGMRLALRGRSEEVTALATQLAAAGGAPPAVTALVSALQVPHPSEPTSARRLSPGEQALLERLAVVAGNRELAEQLGISTNTLKTRLRRLYAKLGVHDRASALRVAGSRSD